MNLKRYKPTTPSLRHRVIVSRAGLTKSKPIKKLTTTLNNSGGRNNQGRITSYHKGGGVKKKYRLIDFKRSIIDIPAKVTRLEYDPNRSAFIALVCYINGSLSYILAPDGLKEGDVVISSSTAEIKVGNATPLSNIPLGTLVHNIELKPNGGGQLARAAGTYARLIKKNPEGYATLKLSSGEQRQVSLNSFATIGRVSNLENKNISKGKAGANRWLNRRPVVRGVAMNPVDHPHGGGEGKTSGGRVSVTPWGKPTKGKPTRRKRLRNRFIEKPRNK